jgi:hypothetical protein
MISVFEPRFLHSLHLIILAHTILWPKAPPAISHWRLEMALWFLHCKFPCQLFSSRFCINFIPGVENGDFYSFYIFFSSIGVELRTLYLQGRCSTTWTTSPAFLLNLWTWISL